MNVRPILGTMNFGPQVNQDESIKIVEEFISQGYAEFDTAYVYNNGDSEKFLGHAIKNKKKRLVISTKVNPKVTGKLDRKSIKFQFSESLKRLGVLKVDILYLHFPDPSTPIRETLEAISELKNDGQINELGLSNYSSKEVKSICEMCEKYNLLMPSVYQGMYNAFNRNVESELIPCLREFEIRFYAYNPLAGGILSGKYKSINNILPGRFTIRPNYIDRYWNKFTFESLNLIKKSLRSYQMTLIETAFKWISHHSILDFNRNDAIILGVSDIGQLKSNLSYLNLEPLPQTLFEAYEISWKKLKDTSKPYFRTV